MRESIKPSINSVKLICNFGCNSEKNIAKQRRLGSMGQGKLFSYTTGPKQGRRNIHSTSLQSKTSFRM